MLGNAITIDRRTLTGQFAETPAQELNKLREVYRVRVPRGEVWAIDRTRPFICFLTAVETVVFPANTNGLSEASLTANQITRVLNAADTHVDARYVGVWLTSDGSARIIDAVGDHVDGADPGSVQIAASEVAPFNCQVAYVPYENAHLVLSIDAPVGLGERSHPIFEGDAKSTFGANQWLHQRIRGPILLPPDYSIVLKVNAGWPVAFENGATAGESEIPFNQIRIPIVRYSEMHFHVAGEAKPGHTLRTVMERQLAEAVR